MTLINNFNPDTSEVLLENNDAIASAVILMIKNNRFFSINFAQNIRISANLDL